MAERVKTSAPGKLVLFGEHAVVYGYSCIVTAVDQRMEVTVSLRQDKKLLVKANQVGVTRYDRDLSELGRGEVPKAVSFIEFLIKNFYQQYGICVGLNVFTHSQFSANFGFGSSAAVIAALALALSRLFSIELSQIQLFDLCFQTILDVQGVGSGFDAAAAIYGGTLHYAREERAVEPVEVSNFPLVVGYTGIKADTPTLVRQVAELKRQKPKTVEGVFIEIERIVVKALQVIKAGNFAKLGTLMDKNQKLLERLGVSSRELEELMRVSRQEGAWGAKLSGAGGGDCMITLVADKIRKEVETAIEECGGEVLQVKFGAEGVREE